MARIDRERLNGATFPVSFMLQTRFDDLDMQGHVNNAAAVVMLQEARAHFNRTAAGIFEHLGGRRALVAGLTVEYAGEMQHPAPIEIRTGVLAVGRSSITLGQIAFQDGAPRLYAQIVLVIADDGGPTTIPDTLRAAYERLMIA